MFNLKKFRIELEAFSNELGIEFYKHGAGLKKTFEVSKIYEKYGHLYTLEMLNEINKEVNRAKGELNRSLKYIREFIFSNFMENKNKKLIDKFYSTEAMLKVEVNGEKLPYRYCSVIIANEGNREKRERIFNKRLEVEYKELNPIMLKIVESDHETAKELGFKNYKEMYQEILGIDLDKLLSKVLNLSKKLEKVYINGMNEILEDEMGINLKEAEKHDIAHLFRAKKFDKFFKKEKAVPLLKRFYREIGIDMEKQSNIKLDLEERPNKSPRAFMVPIKVPEDVRLVVLPKGGIDDYRSLFHEAGHLEHYANVDPNLEPEFKYLGDTSVTETYAFLSEYMLIDISWLKDHLKIEELENYLKFELILKTYFIRRYTAKLEYEIKLHTMGLKGMDKVYKETLEKHLIFKHPMEHYLLDVDPGFYSSQYLRAWLLEAMLREELRNKLGEKWYTRKESGEFLIGLWRSGQKYTADEIAVKLGYSGIIEKPFYEQLIEML